MFIYIVHVTTAFLCNLYNIYDILYIYICLRIYFYLTIVIIPRLPNTLWGGIWTPKTYRSNTEPQDVFGRLGNMTFPKNHWTLLWRGLTLFFAGFWDLQTTSFEIPWFLGLYKYIHMTISHIIQSSNHPQVHLGWIDHAKLSVLASQPTFSRGLWKPQVGVP